MALFFHKEMSPIISDSEQEYLGLSLSSFGTLISFHFSPCQNILDPLGVGERCSLLLGDMFLTGLSLDLEVSSERFFNSEQHGLPLR